MVFVRSVVVALCVVASTARAPAGERETALAAAVPVEVAEVVSGGSWIDGQASGSFRTITIQVAGNTELAQVYLQWIGSRSPVDPIEVISSLPLREFNEQALASASVSLEGDIDGAAKIVIAGQDAEARPVALLTFIASLPGVYKVIPSAPVR
jgi:hypothetical protein